MPVSEYETGDGGWAAGTGGGGASGGAFSTSPFQDAIPNPQAVNPRFDPGAMRRRRRVAFLTNSANTVYGNARAGLGRPRSPEFGGRPAPQGPLGVPGGNYSLGVGDAPGSSWQGRLGGYLGALDQSTRGAPGYADLSDPNGSATLFGNLYEQGVREASGAGRRAILAARARQMPGEGVPYGMQAAAAERDAYSALANNLLDARTQSIQRNQDFNRSQLEGRQHFLENAFGQNEGYANQALEAEKNRVFTRGENERNKPKRKKFLGIFARGTAFAPGGKALVGEEGPEMVLPPRRAASRGRGSVTKARARSKARRRRPAAMAGC